MNDDHDDHEDRLRRALRDEAAAIHPTPGAWERIEARAGAGRRQHRLGARTLVALSTAAAVLVGVVAVASLTGDDRATQVKAGPAGRPQTPVTAPAPAEPKDDGPGIWPFRTAAESDAVSTDRWNDPKYTAERFLRDYVGFTRLVMGQFNLGDARSGEVTASTRRDGPVTIVLVRRLGSGAGGPWTVVGATTHNIELQRPSAMEEVTSPVHIEGRSTAFEGNVVIEVRRDGQLAADGDLGLRPLIGGSTGEMGPLAGDVPFTTPDTTGGAVVASTDSAMDGAVEEAAVVRVLFGAAGTPKAEDVIAFDEARRQLVVLRGDGEPVRVLAELAPGTEFGGLAVAPDRRTVYLSEVKQDACRHATTRPVHAGRDPASPPMAFGEGSAVFTAEVAGRSPAVSPDGKWLAVAADADCDGLDELVVESLVNYKEQSFPDLNHPSTQRAAGRPVGIAHLSWAPDGRSVAYEARFEDGTDLQLHDVANSAVVSGDAQRVGGGNVEPSTMLRPALQPGTPVPGQGLFVAVSCCGDPPAKAAHIRQLDFPSGSPFSTSNGDPVRDTGAPIRSMVWQGAERLLIVGDDGAIRALETKSQKIRTIATGHWAAAG